MDKIKKIELKEFDEGDYMAFNGVEDCPKLDKPALIGEIQGGLIIVDLRGISVLFVNAEEGLIEWHKEVPYSLAVDIAYKFLPFETDERMLKNFGFKLR